MSPIEHMKTLTKKEVVGVLASMVRHLGQGAAAKELGISRQYLYRILTGTKDPGPTVLAYLHLKEHDTHYVSTRSHA